MTESRHLWPLLKANVPAHWTRIENKAGVGEPDIVGLHNGYCSWVEGKIIHGNKFAFRSSQPAWIMKAVSEGGRVFVLARKNNTMILWSGKHIPELLRRGTAIVDKVRGPEAPKNLSIDLASLVMLRKPWNWTLMREVLFGRE